MFRFFIFVLHFHVILLYRIPGGYPGDTPGIPAFRVPRGTPLTPFGPTSDAISTILEMCHQKHQKNLTHGTCF